MPFHISPRLAVLVGLIVIGLILVAIMDRMRD
jgi:preprotein translocase subunit Sec61beta